MVLMATRIVIKFRKRVKPHTTKSALRMLLVVGKIKLVIID